MENVETAPSGVAEQTANQPTNNIPGAAPGETKSETMARMYKVKVDGQDMEVDEAELLRGYAHEKASQKRMQEAAMSKQEAAQVLRLFKENPREAFKMLGSDARQFAESVIQDELNEAMLSPEQKEMRKIKADLEKYQNNEKSARETYEREQRDAEMARYTEQVQSDIVTTLETAGLPKTERTVGRIAYYMQAALQAGFGNVTPKDVIEYVKNDYITDIKSMVGTLPEEALEAFLGKDVVSRIAKSTVKAGMPVKTVPKEVNANIQRKSTEKKHISPREYFKR